jgi:hypothetical protein
MVRDWLEALQKGQDAMMIAQRNAEVAKLNELAREVRRQEGQLGSQEVKVGEEMFAAGDHVITRVNDRQADVYNRERWEVSDVDPANERVVLDGLDMDKQVELGPDYLFQRNPYSDAPALEHAYAVTTYSAQGSTVDQAFVAVDPSMDKQEMYVATSRSREETHLYATPEIQAEREREEIAPTAPHPREDISHIAEAAERDRAQVAAHEVSLRARFEGLPYEQLVERHAELAVAADREKAGQDRHDDLSGRIAEMAERYEQNRAQRRVLEDDAERMAMVTGRPAERSQEQARLEFNERHAQRGLERLEGDLAKLPPPSDVARSEFVVADQVLAARERPEIVAARAAPPPYITKELGQRPTDPAKQQVWDRAVGDIQSFRMRNGITDPKRALGREVDRTVQRDRQRQTQSRIREAKRQLGRGEFASRGRSTERGFGSAGRAPTYRD